ISGGAFKFTPAVGVAGNNAASFNLQVKDDGGTALGGSDTDGTANTATFNLTPPVPNTPPNRQTSSVSALADTTDISQPPHSASSVSGSPHCPAAARYTRALRSPAPRSTSATLSRPPR